MGIFTNITNPVWRQVSKLSKEKQISYGVVICYYDYLFIWYLDITKTILQKIEDKGIISNDGKRFKISNYSDLTIKSLVNNLILGILFSDKNIYENSSEKLKFISPNRLSELIIVPYFNG